MSSSQMGLGSLPSATGGYYSSPRQAGMGFGGYTGLSPQDELYAQQFGKDAQNGNFWGGAALWTVGAGLAGTGTVAMERQWLKETHGNYLKAKHSYIIDNLTDGQWDLVNANEKMKAYGDENLSGVKRIRTLENSLREGYIKNLPQLDNNPYKGVNKVLSDAHDYAKVALNEVDPKGFEQLGLSKTTGLGKAAGVAGAVLAGGLLISHLSASGEGASTTELARNRLAMLRMQEREQQGRA